MRRRASDVSAEARAKLATRARLPDKTDPSTPSRNLDDASRDGDASDQLPRRILEPPKHLTDVAFHGLAGEIVKLIDPHTEADPAAILVQLLVAFGNAIGRSAHFRVEADEHYLNLYALLVGSTAAGRKGTSWAHVQRVIGDGDPQWKHQCITSGLSTGEGLIWAVRDPIVKSEPVRDRGRTVDHQSVIDDPGVTDKRCLVIEPEFGRTLKVMQREQNTLSTVIRLAWDSGNLKTMTRNSTAQATGAHISVIGHITPLELGRLLSGTDVANGFLNRFLVLTVRRSKCLPDGGSLSAQALAPAIQRVRKALEFGRGVQLMQRDVDASELWRRVYPKLTAGKPGAIGAVTSRGAPQVMRIACIYALLDCSNTVSAVHLAAALELQRYVEASVGFIFGDRLGDPIADAILEALRANRGGLDRTEIHRLFSGHASKEAIDCALTALLAEGLASVRSTKTRGRPKEIWTVQNAKKEKKAKKPSTAKAAVAAVDSPSPLSSLSSPTEGPLKVIDGVAFFADGSQELTVERRAELRAARHSKPDSEARRE